MVILMILIFSSLVGICAYLVGYHNGWFDAVQNHEQVYAKRAKEVTNVQQEKA